MADRLTVGGEPVITEDESSGDVGGHFESVETDRLSGTHHYLDADATVADIQATIDDISTDTGGAGGTVHLHPSATYSVDGSSGVIQMRSHVVLNLHGATIRLADGSNDNAPSNSLIIFEQDNTTTTDAHVMNGEVDGNLPNNASFSNRRTRGGVSISDKRYDGSGSVVDVPSPERCTVRNMHIHHTIASNLYLSGTDCAADTVWLNDSGNDHWLYVPSGVDCVASNVWCSGAARLEGIVFGNSDDRDCKGNTLENVTVKNVVHSPVSGANIRDIVHFRPAGSSSGAIKDNSIHGLSVRAVAPAEQSSIRVESPSNMTDVHWSGETNTGGDGVIHVTPDATGSSFDTVDMDVTNTTATSAFPFVYDRGASNIDYEGFTIRNSGSQGLVGFQLFGADGAMAGNRITDYDIDVQAAGVNVGNNPNGVTDLFIGAGTITAGVTEFDIGGDATLGDGCMIPFDVTLVGNPYHGRTQYNDGTVGTEGPCFYNGSSWVSSVDGSTIA